MVEPGQHLSPLVEDRQRDAVGVGEFRIAPTGMSMRPECSMPATSAAAPGIDLGPSRHRELCVVEPGPIGSEPRSVVAAVLDQAENLCMPRKRYTLARRSSPGSSMNGSRSNTRSYHVALASKSRTVSARWWNPVTAPSDTSAT